MKVAQEILATIAHEKTVQKQKIPFNLCGVENATGDVEMYKMPNPGSVDHYTKHVSTFPTHDSPEIFGIHQNARM